jgi:DNA polymerase-3 subunit gamma/tau
MSYQVLARKWRPRRFEELVGQEHVVRPLVNALEHGRLHHAFLFTGTRGVGKTTIARILAKSLNCETGVTASPCGRCSACTEVDEGRFVDLIEVDAASRTKVDDTRELLDNVQYAPARGRYKVYLIDEVHMLSGHSFNALLKTLEEPPPHVKFLLATTDPQKLPVTVLSRCLQFTLKRLTAAQVEGQLRHILEQEGIAHDAGSLRLLARAADGSMRDGLSLLDQAIAYGGGKLGEAEVRAMLGTIDQGTVERLLGALAAGDATAVMAVVADAHAHSADGLALLDELLRALHAVALAQADRALAADEEIAHWAGHAEALSPEDVQLYYQIGVLGRRDLPYAPDPRIGLEMVLLRMLAFRPASAGEGAPPAAAAPQAQRRTPAVPATTAVEAKPRAQAAATAATAAPQADPAGALGMAPAPVTPRPADVRSASWSETVAALPVTGLLRELAANTFLETRDGDRLELVVAEAHARLLNKERETELRKALEKYFGGALRVTIRVGHTPGETPAQEKQRKSDERQQAAEQAIENDPNVQALIEQFNARVNPASIRPKV